MFLIRGLWYGNYITQLGNPLRMPKCANCDAVVTEQYVRVFAPSGMKTVRVCPNCPDMVRDGGDVREAKAPRQ
jgi:NAD-dependent SIR2 family protein deacetylase